MRVTATAAGRDGDAVDLVTRTLHAVAAATPVADDARPVGGEVVLRVRADRQRRWGRRATVQVVAAAAAAVVLVAAAVWSRGGDDVETSPTDPSVPTAPRPDIRMEAGWLPGGFGAAPSVVQRTPGIDVVVEAVLWGEGDETVVAAAVDLGGADADPNIVARRTETVRGVLEGAFRPPDATHMATSTSSGRGGVALTRAGVSTDAAAVADRIAGGVSPAEAAPDGQAPTPLPLDWLAEIGPAVSVGYQTEDQSAAVAITVVSGRLPEAPLVQVFLPGATPVDVRGRSGWSVVPPGSDDTWVTWQEAPGLVVRVAGGLPHDQLLTVAEGLVAVDETAAAAAPPDVIAEGTVEGMAYRIERTPGEGTDRGWCATAVIEGDEAGRVCQQLVDGQPLDENAWFPVASFDGGILYLGSVPAGVATVSVDGSPVETVDAAPGDMDGFPVALVPVPDATGSVTFRLRGAGGEDLGTVGIDHGDRTG
jgi:hypothetical protein